MSVRRFLNRSTIVCITLGVLLFIYIRPLTLLSMVRWKASAKPEFWTVPSPLADRSIEKSNGKRLTLYGYQFEVPWANVTREEHLKQMEFVYFSEGFVLVFHDPAQNVNQLKILTAEGTKNEAGLKKLFGEETTRSNYSLLSTILNLTPRDLRLSFSRQKMVSSSALLMLKPRWTGTVQGGLYSFQTDWLRGFQQGDPTKDETVVIDAFDAHDNEIEISVGRVKSASRDATQPELNRIIYSLQPIPANQTR
jgi:hypothetical protein